MKSYRCWAEIDLDALRENLVWLRDRVGAAVRIMTVVKADAYGHGLKQIAALLMQSGTDIFGVANLEEARSIRAVGRGWPVLMLGGCLPDEMEPAVRDGVMPTLSSLAEARGFARVAARLNTRVDVHIKIDTGMGRLGVSPARAGELVHRVARLPGLRIAGVYTHFAAAEDDADRTRRQLRRFRKVLEEVSGRGIKIPTVHASNSAAVLYEAESMFNLVRPGLLVYGVIPPGRRQSVSTWQRHLRPALTFKCRVSLVKEINRGTPLSYGATFVARRPMRVATVTAGYGDGFPRSGSDRADVLIRGRRCRVLGRVTMDQTLVDVSTLPRVRAGDEVVLIGGQGREAIGVGELASRCGTIPWEILTGISHRVPRIYRGGCAA